MKIISDRSLVCFLHDLRLLLLRYKGQLPRYVDFINIESFNFYLRMGYPAQSRELADLMEIIEPFIPMIVSPQNLEDVIAAYEEGNLDELASLEENYIGRSKFIFINSVMAADGEDWENILAICRKIREIKSQQMVYV